MEKIPFVDWDIGGMNYATLGWLFYPINVKM